jgi:uncharacterized membrane protein YcaP (DUF421 family)
VRLSGKRTIRQGSAFDFTIALVIGDMVDNVIFDQAPAVQFVTAVATLMSVHLLLDVARFRTGLSGGSRRG